jgi:hypothetical protein
MVGPERLISMICDMAAGSTRAGSPHRPIPFNFKYIQ